MKKDDYTLIWEALQETLSVIEEQPMQPPQPGAPSPSVRPTAAAGQVPPGVVPAPEGPAVTQDSTPAQPATITPIVLKQAPAILRAVAQLLETNGPMIQKLLMGKGHQG